MRIWDFPIAQLCTKHLVAEHCELHTIWATIVERRDRYPARHPETNRWRGKLAALYQRHEQQVRELRRRGLPSGLRHRTPLDKRRATGQARQRVRVNTLDEQRANMRGKGWCTCDAAK